MDRLKRTVALTLAGGTLAVGVPVALATAAENEPASSTSGGSSALIQNDQGNRSQQDPGSGDRSQQRPAPPADGERPDGQRRGGGMPCDESGQGSDDGSDGSGAAGSGSGSGGSSGATSDDASETMSL